MNEFDIIHIYTDGACSGNPGPGGWAAIIQFNDKEVELSGGEENTTNNRMELLSVIYALDAIKPPSVIHITSDSKYVLDGITKWLHEWKQKSWKTSSKKEVKNLDLWQRLDKHNLFHKISWHYIAGHSGHKENERCDLLARREIKNLLKK